MQISPTTALLQAISEATGTAAANRIAAAAAPPVNAPVKAPVNAPIKAAASNEAQQKLPIAEGLVAEPTASRNTPRGSVLDISV